MSKQTIEDIYPLSPSQQGMLFFLLFSGFEGQVYFDQFVSTVTGRLDTEAWRRAWSRVMERHATLRTQFLWERRDEPLQVVWRGVQLPFQVLDWRALPEPEREERFAAFLREDHDRGFDIGKAPLMRIAVVRWADEVYKFVGSFHHLVLDGWSMGIILNEALSQYHALIDGRDLQLPVPRRYRDYIGWVARQDLTSAESFWKRLLAGFPGRAPLPLDGTGPGGKVTAGWVTREELVYVSPEITQGLNAFARQHQVTPNTLFQAAWCLLLGRYAASSDVVFGTVVSGRPAHLEGVESMVGMFINALPVRVRIDPGAALIPWLKELQALQVELREYDYCPLELIQGWSGLGRQTALFDSLLVYENYPVNAVADGGSSGLAMQQARLTESGSIPLTLFATPQGDRIQLRFNYHWTRLSPAAARRIVAQLMALFEGFVARPQTRLRDFTRLTEAERQELLALGAGSRVEVPAVAVHRLVEEQAARSPEAAAVEADGCVLTYAELEARAGRLARHLVRLGVGPESIVGLCAERSLDMVVGLLGVLKAGAAYLPLDPAYPGERLAFMLEDSGARWVLAVSGLVERLPAISSEIVLLDGEIAPDDGSPLPAVDPRHPAYVIYTSGSTGRPKGVLVSHAALADAARSAGESYGIGPADRVLQFASISFDTSAEEIYPCLSRGATLVLRSDEMAGSLDRFVRESGELGITVLDLPTAYWHELVAEMIETGLALPSSLRLVILGGEAAQADRLAAWRERVAGVRLVNTYGPTEATIVSTSHELTDGIGSTEVPIGRPLPNARTYVAGRGLELVPVGVEGELVIGGAGLARGYLGRPGLTAERFVPDPFSAAPGARLYRSGDLVRLLPEGDLEFRGRTDDQVKVRGFRIELGEIEAVLRRHAGVRDAVVVAREDAPAQKRLVAYVVPEGEPAPSAFELRTVLENELPRYMVPSVFVTLAALPLTPSGKVDRRALPAPEVSRADVEAGYTAPCNEVQEVLAGIWSDLLGVERVGIHDDFFQLGGHSLVVARLASRIRQAFKVELPLVEVFHRPTIAGLSEAVQKAERTAVDIPDLPPIRRAPRDQAIPLSFPQERVWFLDQISPGGNLAYNFQVTIWLRGPLDVAVLNRTLSEIVRRHESLRTSFPTVEGRPVQVIHEPYPVVLPVADLRAVPAERREEESERVVFEATQTPFDLTSIPLIRWRLLRLEDEIWELVQVEHHFVHDGWSFSVLLREIKTIYEAFLRGRPSPLPELTVQYADFALWQREWMAGPAMDPMLGYWKKKLAGSPTILELPADRPRPERPAFKGELSLSRMPPDLYEGLRAFGRKNGFTLFMTTLTGFFALVERYTGQEDVLLGTSNANRRTREIEELIGMIVNSLVLRGDMTGDPTVLKLLGRIRETSLESYAYQDMPLERLVQELRPERQLGRNPLFQLMFGFHDAAVPDLDFGGLKGSFLVRGNRSAKMDMNVIIVPRAEQRVGLAASAADRSAVLHWEYSTELFDGSTIERMIGHYLTLLRGMVEAPETPLSALPVLGEQEVHQVVREWSGAPAAGSRSDCLHEIFERRARQMPEAVALTFGSERLSYGELDRRANRLAHRLLAWGIGRGSRVGLCLERSLDLVTGILGILKAGAAYVPLDPAYPKERLAFLVEDSGAEALVTEEKLRTNLPKGLEERGRVLCLDSNREEIERQSSAPPASGVTAQDVAYVIYTSGSTGQPKGVAVPHTNVVELFAATADLFGFGPQDVWTLFHSFAFDFSVWELWGALLHGGRLVVVPYWASRSPQAFYELLDRERVTVLNQTPSVFRQLAWAEEEAGAAGEVDLALRWVIFGGEALDVGSLRPWFERHGEERPRLVNMYGITETTVHVTCRELGLRDLGAGSVLGRPIPGWKVLLLDRGLAPVAPGIPGEIYVGGRGLALGYLGRVELTATRFVPDPFSGEPGGRLYRSGDLARFRPDGDLEYLGRIDDQVKIRGFRIEPGEIEAVLASHPAVREVAVVAREHRGERRLVAYVAAAEPRPAPGELRELVRQRQPEPMVPAAFVLLDRLPLTPNGKVDRKALPDPEEGRGEMAVEYLAPRNPIEQTLAGIWSEVLGLEKLGVHDNFFDLGGHSLSATRVFFRVLDAYGVKLPLSAVFEKPTIEGLAGVVADALAGPQTVAFPLPLQQAPPPTGGQDLLAHAAGLSDADLDALLGEMAAEGDRA
jgi:amino acid adenylation domain-containing protein